MRRPGFKDMKPHKLIRLPTHNCTFIYLWMINDHISRRHCLWIKTFHPFSYMIIHFIHHYLVSYIFNNIRPFSWPLKLMWWPWPSWSSVSSFARVTHQSHISQVSANDGSLTHWPTSLITFRASQDAKYIKWAERSDKFLIFRCWGFSAFTMIGTLNLENQNRRI